MSWTTLLPNQYLQSDVMIHTSSRFRSSSEIHSFEKLTHLKLRSAAWSFFLKVFSTNGLEQEYRAPLLKESSRKRSLPMILTKKKERRKKKGGRMLFWVSGALNAQLYTENTRFVDSTVVYVSAVRSKIRISLGNLMWLLVSLLFKAVLILGLNNGVPTISAFLAFSPWLVRCSQLLWSLNNGTVLQRK